MDNFLPYVAGLFDGEGWISIERRAQTAPTKSTHPKYTLIVGIHMCDETPLLLLKERWGGNLSHRTVKQGWRPSTTWMVQAVKAHDFLRDIKPYLIIKKERALLAIEFVEHIQRYSHLRYQGYQSKSLPDSVYAEREDFFQRFRQLNARGVKQPV